MTNSSQVAARKLKVSPFALLLQMEKKNPTSNESLLYYTQTQQQMWKSSVRQNTAPPVPSKK
jgi:hypothetical protein